MRTGRHHNIVFDSNPSIVPIYPKNKINLNRIKKIKSSKKKKTISQALLFLNINPIDMKIMNEKTTTATIAHALNQSETNTTHLLPPPHCFLGDPTNRRKCGAEVRTHPVSETARRISHHELGE